MPLRGRKRVNKVMSEQVSNLNDGVKGVYLSGLTQIVEAAPVDSGRVRNNFFLTVSAPASDNKERAENKQGSGSLTDLQKMPDNVLGKRLYFTNNLPYAETLEYGGYPDPVKIGSYDKETKSNVILSINGFSKQAPSGWVRKALARMKQKIKQL